MAAMQIPSGESLVHAWLLQPIWPSEETSLQQTHVASLLLDSASLAQDKNALSAMQTAQLNDIHQSLWSTVNSILHIPSGKLHGGNLKTGGKQTHKAFQQKIIP